MQLRESSICINLTVFATSQGTEETFQNLRISLTCNERLLNPHIFNVRPDFGTMAASRTGNS